MTDEKMITYTDDEGNRIAIIGKTKVIYKKMSDVEKKQSNFLKCVKRLCISKQPKRHTQEPRAKQTDLRKAKEEKEAEILGQPQSYGLI